MKANRCGTWSEQVMFRQGYLTSKERQAAGQYGQKCSNCSSCKPALGTSSARCNVGKFAVTINATCNLWSEK